MADLFQSKADLYVVEANQVRQESYEAVAAWCEGVAVVEHDALVDSMHFPAINVPCGFAPVEMKRAHEMNWVVKFPAGYFDVMSDAYFRAIFAPYVDTKTS